MTKNSPLANCPLNYGLMLAAMGSVIFVIGCGTSSSPSSSKETEALVEAKLKEKFSEQTKQIEALVDARLKERLNEQNKAVEALVEAKIRRMLPEGLMLDDIGLNPDQLTDYNRPRIDPVSVPGSVQEQIGIPNPPEGPPTTIPPPPGLGGNQPSSLLENPEGSGGLSGTPGGFGGRKDVPGGLSGRNGAARAKLIEEGGGNEKSELAVAQGLKWLAEHQAPDGHWSLTRFHEAGKCQCNLHAGKSTVAEVDNDVAGTALGLLPFLGVGQTHKSGDGKDKKYAKVVEQGLRYLTTRQTKTGAFDENAYANALAAIAVCEAYALTSDPALKRPCQRAVNYILQAQNDQGSWRYKPKESPGDISVTGWQVMALKSAQMAGLDVPNQALKKIMTWLDSVGNADKSQYGYQAATNEQLSANRTAIGLLCRQYLGWGPKTPGLIEGVKYLNETNPSPRNTYYNYYATQVMHHMGGKDWENWDAPMRDHLINTQQKGEDNPHEQGSWFNPKDLWAGQLNGHGGRVMETSLSILTLEVYYRHLPLYRRDLEGDKSK